MNAKTLNPDCNLKSCPYRTEISDDCISRAYIESIVEELENICINGDEHILLLLSNIKNAPSVIPQQTRWIPVSERLPEKRDYCLITTKLEIHDLKPYYGVYAAKFDGQYFDVGYIGEGVSVIAWQPYPQPYTESEDDECKGCYYNDGEVHAECVICDKAESEED